MSKNLIAKTIYLAVFFSVFICIFPLVVEAQPIEFPNPLEADNFQELIGYIIDIIFTLGLWLAVIMILIAGFYYITAQGDPAKIQTAKKIIIYTIIGLLIIISAKGIVELLKSIFLTNQPAP